MKVDADATLAGPFRPRRRDPDRRARPRLQTIRPPAGTDARLARGETLLGAVARPVAARKVGRAELARIARSAAKSYDQAIDFIAGATVPPAPVRLDLSGGRRMAVQQVAAGRLRKAPVAAPAPDRDDPRAVEVARAPSPPSPLRSTPFAWPPCALPSR